MRQNSSTSNTQYTSWFSFKRIISFRLQSSPQGTSALDLLRLEIIAHERLYNA